MMVHTSLLELVMEAEKGKKEGHPHYVETCPHYLYFSEDSLREKGVRVRCAPTLRDKAYFGVEPRGYSATMRRGTRGHPLGIRDKLRNKRINRKRAPGERPFAVIKRMFNAGHVLVTTVERVRVKMMFACFCFNLVQLGTLAGRA